MGLICGVQLDVPGGPVVDTARDMGLLLITAGKGDILRLVPPLVVTDKEIEFCCETLGKAINKVYPS